MNEDQRRKWQEHNQTPIEDVIAEERLIAEFGKESREVVLQIGRPYVEADGVASCPVASWGINGRYGDVHGESTMQALYLASEMLASAGSTPSFSSGSDYPAWSANIKYHDSIIRLPNK